MVGVILTAIVAAMLAVGGVAAYARWGSFVPEGKDAFRLNALEMVMPRVPLSEYPASAAPRCRSKR